MNKDVEHKLHPNNELVPVLLERHIVDALGRILLKEKVSLNELMCQFIETLQDQKTDEEEAEEIMKLWIKNRDTIVSTDPATLVGRIELLQECVIKHPRLAEKYGLELGTFKTKDIL